MQTPTSNGIPILIETLQHLFPTSSGLNETLLLNSTIAESIFPISNTIGISSALCSSLSSIDEKCKGLSTTIPRINGNLQLHALPLPLENQSDFLSYLTPSSAVVLGNTSSLLNGLPSSPTNIPPSLNIMTLNSGLSLLTQLKNNAKTTDNVVNIITTRPWPKPIMSSVKATTMKVGKSPHVRACK